MKHVESPFSALMGRRSVCGLTGDALDVVPLSDWEKADCPTCKERADRSIIRTGVRP